jgi:hypothetical protein
MKKLLAFLLIAVAIAYYFGYEPSDFIPSFQASSAPPPKDRRPPPPSAEQTPNLGPVRTVTAAAPDDGSLDHRWQSSPAKP